MKTRTIYKLLTSAEWEAARTEGVYRGSPHDRRDGFIHLSTVAQLQETARKHFARVPGLVLLAVDVSELNGSPSSCPSPQGEKERPNSLSSWGEGWGEGGFLRWEPSRGGDLFPHLYGELPVAAVKSVTAIALGEDGVPLIPGGLEP